MNKTREIFNNENRLQEDKDGNKDLKTIPQPGKKTIQFHSKYKKEKENKTMMFVLISTDTLGKRNDRSR